jgi:UDP-N-acetyl-D-mannosaminuronic acid transferase (WecB/TagA/CpsF family)
MECVRVGGYQTVRAGHSKITNLIVNVCTANRDNSRKNKPICVFSSNGQGIALRGKNAEFDEAMGAVEITHADGVPVVIASKHLTRTPVPERSSTTKLFHDIAQAALKEKLNFFVLGSREDLNQRTAFTMKTQYPSLNIVGSQHGYFRPDESADAKTDILWVDCIKTCGGLYTFLSGDASRAPERMQKVRLEWLHRFLQEPRCLFKRYMITNTISAWRPLTQIG